ncbi:TPA: hypothetical protein N0F65_009982 [Lagenidium giganteum]|uniref:Kinesin-like protein n=1 Tax=Lagenidium giganteum TaxID=4803 RepID=A0AAV2ZDP6_9STRA|nr:TPA: hypothetical protein N0F65_009982 [Lagenidium giganteum]
MGKNGVKVIIRTRPTANFATHQIQIDQDENTITIHNNQLVNAGSSSPTRNDSVAAAAPSNRKDCWKFKFHQVLHNAGQDKVYEAIARDIVHGAVVDGVNGTILAYGQTGAGKSFTMIGDTRNYQHRGIAPRAIAQVYEEVENRIEIAYDIRVSYMEIYNDRIYDLLENSATGVITDGENHKGDFVVVEDSKGTYVRGLTQVEARSEQEALDQLFVGELQRTVAEHQLNKRSNRSHCIFTLHISQKSRAGGNERVTHSKLHLVDLAGSERLKKTMDEVEGRTAHSSTTKKESMYINQSLSFLEQCIVALGSKEQRHIPYRQTKLTNVLKDSLGGNSNTLMFACIWGESKHLEETTSTLKLAQRMMRVQNEVATIIETDPMILLRKYEKQIKELKHELVMHDALVERTGVVYDEHTPEQKHLLMKMIRQFVDAPTQDKEDEVLKLNSVHEIRELFRQFKILLRNAETDMMNNPNSAARAGSAGSNASRSQSSTGSRADIHHHNNDLGLNRDDLVGEEETDGVGFGLGIVSAAARPSTMDNVKKKGDSPGRGGAGNGGVTAFGAPNEVDNGPNGGRSRHRSSSPNGRGPGGGLEPAVEEKSGQNNDDGANYGAADGDSGEGKSYTYAARMKNEAFKYYKTGPGKKINKSLQEGKEKLFDCKQKVKMITTRLNSAKEQIDQAKVQLEEKRSHRIVAPSSPSRKGGNGGRSSAVMEPREEIVDEEEFILMTAEREAKRDYRALFDDLKDAKAEMEFTNRSVELLRMRMVREFEDWYEEEGHQNAMSKDLGEDGDEHGYGGAAIHPFGNTFNKEDKLDDGEKFDQMEVDRIRAQDPDSLAFFQAQKKMRQQAGSTSNQSKQTRKAKRGV